MPTYDIDVLCQQQSTSGHIQKIVCLPSLDSVLNFGLEGFFQSHRNIQQRIDLQITGLQNITIITRYQYMQSIKYLDQVLFLHSVGEGKQKSFKSGISHINAQFPCLQTLASVTKKVHCTQVSWLIMPFYQRCQSRKWVHLNFHVRGQTQH